MTLLSQNELKDILLYKILKNKNVIITRVPMNLIKQINLKI